VLVQDEPTNYSSHLHNKPAEYHFHSKNIGNKPNAEGNDYFLAHINKELISKETNAQQFVPPNALTEERAEGRTNHYPYITSTSMDSKRGPLVWNPSYFN
jgi:hypothetical protein